MRFIQAKDYEDMSRIVANMIAAQVTLEPESVLGLATGSTPLGAYERLIRLHKAGDLDFSAVTCVNLDEYVGLGRDDEQSYYYYMNHNFFRHINIDMEKTYIPDGTEADAAKACAEYDAIIEKIGGVDLQLLGLGHNGHIGFNEPGEFFSEGTHCVSLSESTIQANQRFFLSYDDVPKFAYTMGVGTIMSSYSVLVAVSGQDKARIVKDAFFGPVTPDIPASILKFHPDVTVVGDEAAFSLI